jgi:hypothetical protein
MKNATNPKFSIKRLDLKKETVAALRVRSSVKTGKPHSSPGKDSCSCDGNC